MLYFAYGSNMDPGQMRRRCPGARALGAARLAEHRLCFTWDSSRWGGGVGHVEAATDGEVWGVLWDLTEDHVASLDRYEQVAEGVYRREWIQVEHDGASHDVLVYLSNDGRERRPSRRYLRALIRGARAHGLPDAYIGLLEGVRPR